MLSMSRDISIDLSCLLMKFSGIWLAANRQEQIYRNITLTYTVVTLSFGVYIDIADFYNTWGDVSNCLYMACNILCIGMGLYKTGILFIHKLEFVDLVLYAQRNFWHSDYDDHEKSLIAESRKFFTPWITFVYIVIQAIVVNYALAPIVANFGRNKSDRALPFNMWINLPLSETPYYEMMFAFQTLCVWQIAVCYVCFDNFLCMINIHVACQFRILQYRMSNLWPANDEQMDVVERKDRHNTMFKRCIRQHQALIEYCKKVENVFTLTVLGHLLVFSVLMCLVGYQILMAESSTPRRLIFIFHIFGSFVQIVMYTYSCDGLIEESSNIGTAVYSSAWTTLPMDETGRSLRKDMQLIIMRSTHPCYLTAGGFFPVCLETSTAADSAPTRRLIFIFCGTGSICQLLLFTYSCDGLIEESANIGVAVYSGPWLHLPMSKLGRLLQKDLMIVIIRSQKPCCLTASGFFPVSLETCTKVLSTAMSYFTLLRQSMVN